MGHHDAPLRKLARDQSMPGWIQLAFAREPSWFADLGVHGHTVQTIVGENGDATVAGCGVRALRRVYLNGAPGEIGYLGGLRSFPAARRRGSLAGGYRFLRALHETDHAVPAYLTTILEDNTDVIRLLTSARAGLPTYADRGRLLTTAIPLGRARAARPPAGLELRTARGIPPQALIDFLNTHGRTRQFFPVLGPDAFASSQFQDLDPSEFRVALSGSEIVGAAAPWDQGRYRQARVAGYTASLRWARPAINAALRLAGYPSLPAPGQILEFFHVALACVRADDPVVFRALLDRLRADYSASSYRHFVVGLHEADPLRAALRGLPAFEYASRLFLVCWEDGRAFCEALEANRVPHLETGSL